MRRASVAPGAVSYSFKGTYPINQIKGHHQREGFPSLINSTSTRGDARCSTCWESKLFQHKLHFFCFFVIYDAILKRLFKFIY